MKKNEISKAWIKFFNTLGESQKRWFAAEKSSDLGYGGISHVSRATKLSRTTITQGLKEINNKKNLKIEDGVRTNGGGRKSSIKNDKGLSEHLEKIHQETTAGDPMSSIRWTCKSVRNISEELSKNGHDISYRTVHRLLVEMGYSLQSNRKSLSQENNPDRDRQF
jgi:transposase